MRLLKWFFKMILGAIYARKMSNQKLREKSLSGTYGQLNYIRNYSSEKFVELKKYNDTKNISDIAKCRKVRIGFVLYTSSIWNVDELYNIVMNDDMFEVELILVHVKVQDRTSSRDMFAQTFKYFFDKGYPIKAADSIDVTQYDILFYLTISNIEEKNINIKSIPLKTIVLYTSYSYMLADIPSKFNALLYHISYRYYTDSFFYKSCIEKKDCYTGNARYFGFPKIDQFYAAKYVRRSSKKIIIYAPHHSVHRTKQLRSATFADNYKQIFELAKKYSNETYWIFKPHPSLRSTSVAAGVFKSLDEYDNYENNWDRLDNAEVVSKGDYYSVFKESDAMITDSVSFLAEYQFTHKPLLLLESYCTSYNEFGRKIVDILYKCSGKDVLAIEKFINDVLNENDIMRDERDRFFYQYLDYMNDGISASKKIYKDIKGFVTEKNKE